MRQFAKPALALVDSMRAAAATDPARAIAFGGGLFAYLCALAGVLYSSRLPKVEGKALDDPDRRKNS